MWMVAKQLDRKPWGEQRVRIFEQAETILSMLDRGHSALSVRAQLGMDDIPVRTFHFNVRKLRDRHVGRASEKVEDEVAPLRGESIPEKKTASPPEAGEPSTDAATKRRRKKRKFVMTTVGGNLDDELNPAKWREERLAREERERLAEEKKKDT